MTLKPKIWTLLGVIFLVSGCAVTPNVKDRETIAYHGNVENAGVIGFLDDDSLEVDRELVDTYNSLIEKYGAMFVPEIKTNQGIVPLVGGTFSMKLQAAEDFKRLKNFDKYMTNLERARHL